MRKFVLISILGLLLVNCTNQDVVTDNDGKVSSESSFISISIISAGTSGTRAASDEYTDSATDGTYRDGTNAENKVTNVLLLFFNDSGQPTQAIKDENGNRFTYYVWNPTDTGNDNHNQTVEKILEGTIPISVPRQNNKAVWPTQLLAIVNPPVVSDFTGKSLSALKEIFADYETGLATEGKFVMTNSVYVDGAEEIYTSPLTESNFCEKAEDAKKNPVNIYVERILARIDLKIDINSTSEDGTVKYKKIGEGANAYYIYHTGEKIDNPNENSKDNDVYVRFLGWNVFDTPDQSRLIKEIDKTWKTEDIFGYADGVRPWNISAYRRSFWAINPKERTNENDPKTNGIFHKLGTFGPDAGEGDFNETTHEWTASHNEIPIPGEYTTAYFQENAAPIDNVNNGPTKPSKVILAAQLVNEDGSPRELARWGGELYTWEGLKAHLCNNELKGLYYLTYGEELGTGNRQDVYKSIAPDDLDYELDAEKGYRGSIILSTSGQSKNWYKKEGNVFTAVAVNDVISSSVGDNSVALWKNGYTYFYFTIRHLGMPKQEGQESSFPGEFGVVRNHIYEATVTSVSGLGTPVNKPDEVIIPSEGEETGVIAAKINILSWRVVREDYDLTW